MIERSNINMVCKNYLKTRSYNNISKAVHLRSFPGDNFNVAYLSIDQGNLFCNIHAV